MKGIIPMCTKALVLEKFGEDIWRSVLTKSGMDPDTSFFAHHNIDDAAVMKIINSLCEILNVTLEDVANLFGEYWVEVFAKKVYFAFYNKPKNAKDFLLAMDDVHVKITKDIENASPPRFTYNWKDDKTLIMSYSSARGLFDFFIGLVKGVGSYFKENLSVKRLNNTDVEIQFAY